MFLEHVHADVSAVQVAHSPLDHRRDSRCRATVGSYGGGGLMSELPLLPKGASDHRTSLRSNERELCLRKTALGVQKSCSKG